MDSGDLACPLTIRTLRAEMFTISTSDKALPFRRLAGQCFLKSFPSCGRVYLSCTVVFVLAFRL